MMSIDTLGGSSLQSGFVVLLVGTVLLTGLIYFRWERDESSSNATEESESQTPMA